MCCFLLLLLLFLVLWLLCNWVTGQATRGDFAHIGHRRHINIEDAMTSITHLPPGRRYTAEAPIPTAPNAARSWRRMCWAGYGHKKIIFCTRPWSKPASGQRECGNFWVMTCTRTTTRTFKAARWVTTNTVAPVPYLKTSDSSHADTKINELKILRPQ